MTSRIRWLPFQLSQPLGAQIWILFWGRLLSQTGTGFTLFFASIFFVNQVGLTATEVGAGLGVMALTGVIGRIVGGSLADAAWGRKRTLLLSLGISAVGGLGLAGADSFWTFALANGVAGLGQGLYWPASEAIIADLTPPEQRTEAFALNRLGDSLGNSIGVALAGILVSVTGAYRPLFVIDAISFGVFGVLVYRLVTESRPDDLGKGGTLSGWKIALSDRRLQVYVLANVLFTTYLSQVSTSLPLYFNNFIFKEFKALSPTTLISGLFMVHGILIVLLQLPMVRWLKRWSHLQGLKISALAWGLGFGLVLVTRIGSLPFSLGLAVIALGILALATVVYNPAASALVVELAPPELRGVYLSINALCWAAGFGIGPLIGGIWLDFPDPWASSLWLIWMLSIGVLLWILTALQKILSFHQAANVGAMP